MSYRLIGNTEYNSIKEKAYINGKQEDIMRLADELEQNGINYSGRISEYRSAITVEATERRKAIEIMNTIVRKSENISNNSEKNIIGNTEYRYIANKRYIKGETEAMLRAADRLTAENIPFSGKKNGNTVTLTVSGDEMQERVKKYFREEINRDQTVKPIYLLSATSDGYEDGYYISEVNANTGEEISPYRSNYGDIPMFVSVDEALHYTQSSGIELSNTDNQFDEWRKAEKEKGHQILLENSREIIQQLPMSNQEYEEHFIFHDNVIDWIYFNSDGNNGEGKFIETTIYATDIINAYKERAASDNAEVRRKNFLESITHSCEQKTIEAGTVDFENYARHFISDSNDSNILKTFGIYENNKYIQNVDTIINRLENHFEEVRFYTYNITEQLCELARKELEEFENSLDTVEKVKAAANELTVKRDILSYIQNELSNDITDKDTEDACKRLISSGYPLDTFYQDWLKNEYDNRMEVVKISTFNSLKKETQHFKTIEKAKESAHSVGLPFRYAPNEEPAEDFDHYSINGSMTIEDYELMHKHMKDAQAENQEKTDELFTTTEPSEQLSFFSNSPENFIDNKESQEMFERWGLQLSELTNTLDFDTIIHPSRNIVKGSEEKAEITKPETSKTANREDNMLMGRLVMDCKYYLKTGAEKHLWADTVEEHIDKMRELCEKFPDNDFFAQEDIDDYAQKMLAVKYSKAEPVLSEPNQPQRLLSITCDWSESDAFEDGKTYSVAEFDSIMAKADKERSEGWKAGLEKYGSEENWQEQDEESYYKYLGYDKTRFTINFPNGETISERQDIGDGYGGVIDYCRADRLLQKYVPILEAQRELDLQKEKYTSDKNIEDTTRDKSADLNSNFKKSVEDYYNKQKADELFTVTGANSPVATSIIRYDDSVTYTTENVKYPDEKNISNEEQHIENNDIQSSDTIITQSDIDVLRTLPPRKSVLNFTEEERKLTSKWAEHYKSDIAEKSPYYRVERGDWRVNEKTKVPIINIPTTDKNFMTADADIKSQVIPRGTVVNNDTNWGIQISRRGLGDTLTYARRHNDISTFNAIYSIDKIVANAVLLDTVLSEKNNNNKANNTAYMHKMYSLIHFNNEPYIAKLNVEEMLGDKIETIKRLYNLHDIKIEPLRHAAFTENWLALSVLNGSDIRISDLFDIVKSFDKDFYTNMSKQSYLNQTKTDYKITDRNYNIEGGAKSRFANNVEAIRLLKKIESENRNATPEEQGILAKYVGWGGIANAFDGRKDDWSKEYNELKSLLTDEEYRAARSSTMNAHYTSPTVISTIYDGLKNLGFDGGKILEPAMGTGNFFGTMPDDIHNNSELHGIELDSLTGRIAKQLYPSANIQIMGYEQTSFENNSFDVAVGNVPFGGYKVNDKDFNKHNFLIHDYFFAKTLDKVRPGGIIAFVTSQGTLDKSNPEVRKYLAERAELLGAIRLPNNAFKANAGTEVTSDIIFLQKRERPISIEDNTPDWVYRDMLPNGITVNKYFAEHPEMILGEMVEGNKMYGNQNDSSMCVPIEGKNLADQLSEAVKNISGKYVRSEISIDSPSIEQNTDKITCPPNTPKYSFVNFNGTLYYHKSSDTMAKYEAPTKKI